MRAGYSLEEAACPGVCCLFSSPCLTCDQMILLIRAWKDGGAPERPSSNICFFFLFLSLSFFSALPQADEKTADGGLLPDANGKDPNPGGQTEGSKWQRPRLTRKSLMKCCLVKWIIASTTQQGPGRGTHTHTHLQAEQEHSISTIRVIVTAGECGRCRVWAFAPSPHSTEYMNFKASAPCTV